MRKSEVLQELNERIMFLESDIKKLQEENDDLKRRVHTLENRVPPSRDPHRFPDPTWTYRGRAA